MRYAILFFSVVFFLAACTPKELPAPKHQQGAALINELAMGENYDYQVFYSLRQNAVIQKNLKPAWDIALECSKEGYHIILNSSKFMFAYNTHSSNLQSVTDTSGFEEGKKPDASSGNLDSTAIGDWRAEKPVFIIDRGSTIAGNIGFVKLQVTAVDDAGYELSFQLLPGGNLKTMHIPKNTDYSFSYLSFENGGEVVNIAPPKADWDLCFTQYTVEIPIPYLVTGVLLNPFQTAAVMDSSIAFDKIDLAYAEQEEFTDAKDVIGYDWKTYDFNAATYMVDPLMNYIIKTRDSAYFKLHFIDFYNQEGVKGNPKWEFMKL